jgi:hypothetical protein
MGPDVIVCEGAATGKQKMTASNGPGEKRGHPFTVAVETSDLDELAPLRALAWPGSLGTFIEEIYTTAQQKLSNQK